MLIAIANGILWQQWLDDGLFKNLAELAKHLGKDRSAVSHMLQLARLSPEIIHLAIIGALPSHITLNFLKSGLPADWEEQKKFLKEFLYPEMKRAGLAEKVGIYIWDHNKERVLEWALDMIDAETAEMIQGIAFHWYSGDHFEAVQMTHEKFPDKVLMLSECCGLHAPGQGSFWESMGLPKTKTPMHAEADDAGEYAHDIIGNLNAGMNVDETGGPRHIPNGFTASCIVENGSARLNMTYYYVKHFSRYILPGARRIGVSRCDQKTEVTAAKNPDGSVAVVALNRGNEDAFYAFRVEGCCVRFGVPAGTISTLVLEQ